MSKVRLKKRFQWLSALPLFVITLILAGLSISTLSNSTSRHGGLRESVFDVYQRLIPAEAGKETPFHTIEIDQESLKKIGPWPWPRSIIAQLVEAAADKGAKGAVYVEAIDVPDPLSPETIGTFWLSGTRDAALAKQLSLLPETDEALGNAFALIKGGVAIDPGRTVRFADKLSLKRADTALAPFLKPASDPTGNFISLPSAEPRYEVKASALSSTQLTVSSLPVDNDGQLRAPPLLWSVDGFPTPLAALEAARIASNSALIGLSSDTRNVTSQGSPLTSLTVQNTAIPLDREARFRLYWPQKTRIPTTPAWRLLSTTDSLRTGSPKRVVDQQIMGKTLLIGLGKSVGGAIVTPRGDISRTQAHALIAQQLYTGAAVKRPIWTGYLEALAVMLFGAAAIIWSQKLSFWRAFSIAAAFVGVVFAISAGAFYAGRLLIDPLPASIALMLGAFSVAGGRSIGAALADDKVRGAYKDALPETTMQKLRDDGPAQILDGARRDITILACELSLLDDDLSAFADRPGEITTMIAAACASLRKSLVEMGGAVDQADGGKIYAYFNAPLETADHGRAACSAALRLVESMDQINSELSSGPLRDVQLHLAIGIAEGKCVIGPMGHGKTNRYSAIGPALDRAAFLRRQAAYYGPAIICDETIYRKTHHHFALLELDRVMPRHKEKPFTVYALVGNPFLKSSKNFRALDENHRQMLIAYRQGDFYKARSLLQRSRQFPGANIALFDIYQSRIDNAIETNPPKDWNGDTQVTI
ncbi:MAG: CHASE2 domain-containing protein [Pseudomonadota bacterium]